MTQQGKRVALVTGGSRGIGAAIVRQLAGDGFNVASTYQHQKTQADEVLSGLPGEHRSFQADAKDPKALSRTVQQVVQEFGQLDVLVNSAGIGIMKPLEQLTLDDFDALIQVNVRAVFAAVQAAVPHLPEGGRIITIGSCNADRVPGPYMSLYAMSKAALVGLTKGVARDLGDRNITVNLVQPGPTDTDMNPADGPFADSQRALTALGRFGQPQEIAQLVGFLAGPQSSYVTGAVLTVDGGYSI